MFFFRILVSILIIGFSVMPAFADEQELAKKSQNPVGDIISLPFEYWHYDGMANGGSADALMVKPSDTHRQSKPHQPIDHPLFGCRCESKRQ
jgi:hypothetical protein